MSSSSMLRQRDQSCMLLLAKATWLYAEYDAGTMLRPKVPRSA